MSALRRWRAQALLLLLLVPVKGALAQPSRVRLVVSDTAGARIAYAVVLAKDGISRATNDSGVVSLELTNRDSARVLVRRMGYEPQDVWIAAGATEHAITMARAQQQVREMRIVAPADNLLFRRGFYDRLEDQNKTSTLARFFTPEDLDHRNAARVTELLAGVSFITMRYTDSGGLMPHQVPIITGRGRCPATVLLDGQPLKGTYEDWASEDRSPLMASTTPIAVDDVVSGSVVSGVEVYAVASGAPNELRLKATRLRCPLVALWTGPRQ